MMLSHPDRQIFWRDEKGGLVAALVRFDAGSEWNHDFFFLPSAGRVVSEMIFPEIVLTITWGDKSSTITVKEDDFAFRRLIEQAGFAANPEAMVQAVLMSDPPQVCLRNGFRIQSRQEEDRYPHHMIQRNGPTIARKLGECSLYRPDLDLVIRDGEGAVAAYGLFWMDSVTKVGLVEPIRTEAAFQRQGLAQYLITEGIGRLRTTGAKVIKVSYKTGNEAAARLYHQVGFKDQFKKIEFRKSPK